MRSHDYYHPPPAPPPPLPFTEGEFLSSDGKLKLRYMNWKPSGPAKASMIVMHGLKDHIDRYEVLARALVAKDINVWGFDMRGHGKSGGDRVFIPDFALVVDDFQVFVNKVLAEDPASKSLFIWGHSIGGCIVTTWQLRFRQKIQGLILAAPALSRPPDAGALLVVTAISKIAPKAAVFMAPPNEAFSKDPQVVKAMYEDPLIYNKDAPGSTAVAILSAFDNIQARQNELSANVLILHGKADKAVLIDGSRVLLEKACSHDKTLREYDGVLHDLLHEPEKEKIIEDILNWLSIHMPDGTRISIEP